LYEAPDFLKTDYICDFYSNADSWKETLYLQNYDKIEHWIPMLDELYKDVIALKTSILDKFTDDNMEIFDKKTFVRKFEWCFLPSDCASCT
jgi:hypothetical protein